MTPSPLRTWGKGALAVLAVAPFMLVFVYMITLALSKPLDITSSNILPTHGLTLENFREVLASSQFVGYIINSLIIGVASTLVALSLGLPAAFALAHWQMRTFGTTFLIARMLPGVALVVPWFVIFTQIGLVDTYLGMTLSHIFVTLPFITWMMIPFFEELPREMWEAAHMDGAGEFRYFSTIALPLVRGGIAAASILAFIFSWNQFMFAVVLSGRNTQTVPVAVFSFLSYGSSNWGQIAAAAVLISLPVVVISLFVQRWIVTGLAGGAVKG